MIIIRLAQCKTVNSAARRDAERD